MSSGRARVGSKRGATDIDGGSGSASKKLKSDDDNRPECKYGASCYRKNPEHFTEFRHAHLDNKNKDKKDVREDVREEEEEESGHNSRADGDGAETTGEINVYLESPDGTQYWRGRCIRGVAWGHSGAVGYGGDVLSLTADTNELLRKEFLLRVTEKELLGWIKKKDPSNPDKFDEEQAYLISPHDPPHLPGFTYFKLTRAGHVVSSEYGTIAEGRPKSFSRWFSTVTDARAAYERWLHKKLAQGYKKSEEPTFQGRDLMCSWGCPYKSNAEHKKYYHHMDPAIAAQLDAAQAACRNPVLVDAWNIMKPQLISSLQQHTPAHMHPLAGLITEYCEPDMHACWKPVTLMQKDVPITRSKIGGRPYLVRGEKWPCCGECKKPMQMWLQLNVSELPVEVQPAIGEPDDLIQLFTCISDDMTCANNYEPFSKGNLVRRIKWTPDGGQPTVVVPVWNSDEPYAKQEEKLITGWTQHTDKVDLGNDDWFPPHDLDEELLMDYEEQTKPVSGDKLCGFPIFVQSPEYPFCPKCHPPAPKSKSRRDSENSEEVQRMRYFFQIDSENHVISFMLGDCGVGQIYYCEKHPDVLAWGWACG